MAAETVPDSFFIHSDMEAAYVSHEFCRLLGAPSQDQLVGTSLEDLIAPDDLPPFREQV